VWSRNHLTVGHDPESRRRATGKCSKNTKNCNTTRMQSSYTSLERISLSVKVYWKMGVKIIVGRTYRIYLGLIMNRIKPEVVSRSNFKLSIRSMWYATLHRLLEKNRVVVSNNPTGCFFFCVSFFLSFTTHLLILLVQILKLIDTVSLILHGACLHVFWF